MEVRVAQFSGGPWTLKLNQMKEKRPHPEASVCVLLSGGMDSAACLAFYSNRGLNVSCMFIDYGQSAARQEDSASRRIAEHYCVDRLALRVQGACPKGPGLVPGRNAFLFTLALMELGTECRLVASGIHKGTSYADCTELFVSSMQSVFDSYTDGVVRIASPFMPWTKREIWDFCTKAGVPVGLTYSCESGGEVPCGRCLSCRDVEVLRGA